MTDFQGNLWGLEWRILKQSDLGSQRVIRPILTFFMLCVSYLSFVMVHLILFLFSFCFFFSFRPTWMHFMTTSWNRTSVGLLNHLLVFRYIFFSFIFGHFRLVLTSVSEVTKCKFNFYRLTYCLFSPQIDHVAKLIALPLVCIPLIVIFYGVFLFGY